MTSVIRHVDVVGDDGEVVGRVTIGAQDDEVFDVGVVEGDRARARGRRSASRPAGTLKRTARGAPEAASAAVSSAGRARQVRSYIQPPPAASAACRFCWIVSVEQ